MRKQQFNLDNPPAELVSRVDCVVKALETRFLPLTESLRARLANGVNGFTEPEIFSHRHAPTVHCLGLECLPPNATALDQLALYVQVLGLSRLSATGSVTWSSCYIAGKQQGAFIEEARTESREFRSDRSIERFLSLMPRLIAVFEGAVRRGVPDLEHVPLQIEGPDWMDAIWACVRRSGETLNKIATP
jgi:hypothetical protein